MRLWVKVLLWMLLKAVWVLLVAQNCKYGRVYALVDVWESGLFVYLWCSVIEHHGASFPLKKTERGEAPTMIPSTVDASPTRTVPVYLYQFTCLTAHSIAC